MGSTTLISSAFTALLNCAEVGRQSNSTNYRFLSHLLSSVHLIFGQTSIFCLSPCIAIKRREPATATVKALNEPATTPLWEDFIGTFLVDQDISNRSNQAPDHKVGYDLNDVKDN